MLVDIALCRALDHTQPFVSDSLNCFQQVTTVPRERNPLGQTVVKIDEDRERNNLYSRQYLEQQLMTVLAGAGSLLLTLEPVSVHFTLPGDCRKAV